MNAKIFAVILIFGIGITSSSVAEGLDLKEANVVRVTYNNTSTQYTFDVTLIHDDDGETPNYADLWIVEDLNENELIRRELLHSHGTVEFTRSGSGMIPETTTKVVVRASDQIHGWGGQVALIDLKQDTIRYFDQGEEKRSFSEGDFSDGSISTFESNQSENNQAPLSFIFLLVLIGVVFGRYQYSKLN